MEPGKIYLLRLVNAASLGYYSFAIAGHSLTIIGTGSSATVPAVVNSVEVSAGENKTEKRSLIGNNISSSYSIYTQ